MAKILTIETCGQCEYSWHEYPKTYGSCSHPDGRAGKLISHGGPIPSWCPFQDIGKLATEIHEQVHAGASVSDIIECLQRGK